MKLDKTAIARIKNATPKKQKGASAIEYIVLAAVIIGLVVALFQSDFGTTITTFFDEEILSVFESDT